jgi:hypothetical protein
VRTLASICANSINDNARVSAANALLDRGWGKAPTTITGEDGEGAVRVVIRHIIEGRDAPREAKVIDAHTRKPLVIDNDGGVER